MTIISEVFPSEDWLINSSDLQFSQYCTRCFAVFSRNGIRCLKPIKGFRLCYYWPRKRSDTTANTWYPYFWIGYNLGNCFFPLEYFIHTRYLGLIWKRKLEETGRGKKVGNRSAEGTFTNFIFGVSFPVEGVTIALL